MRKNPFSATQFRTNVTARMTALPRIRAGLLTNLHFTNKPMGSRYSKVTHNSASPLLAVAPLLGNALSSESASFAPSAGQIARSLINLSRRT